MGKCDVCRSPRGHKGQEMLVLRTTMTVCLGCWYDEGADTQAIADWVSSDEEPEASYDGDPHEREADQDPPNKRAFTDPHEPDPEPPAPDKRRRRE